MAEIRDGQSGNAGDGEMSTLALVALGSFLGNVIYHTGKEFQRRRKMKRLAIRWREAARRGRVTILDDSPRVEGE